MATADYTIVPAEWPQKGAPAKKAIQDFLDSDLQTGEIKGDRDFLIHVRRTARHDDYKDKVEMSMINGRMYIRRKVVPTSA